MLKHHYGSQVKILENHLYSGLLAELCHPQTFQPKINQLVQLLYQFLIAECTRLEFKTMDFIEPTRMTENHPEQKLKGMKLNPHQKVTCVNLARAGTYPSHICYEFMHNFLNPQNIRQDHIFASRAVDINHKVTGTDLASHKIGGDINDHIVLIPDPMGATGGTMINAVNHYKQQVNGIAFKYIALHLIVTPEYLKKVTTHHPDVFVYALRLDRGLSTEAALKSEPGLLWDQEKGLNSQDYIVPGGGGFGEIMNNSFV